MREIVDSLRTIWCYFLMGLILKAAPETPTGNLIVIGMGAVAIELKKDREFAHWWEKAK